MKKDAENGTGESASGSSWNDRGAPEDLQLRCYLLGEELSDEDRDDLEERLVEDGALFGKMRLMEEKLIDDYVLGNLTEGEKRSFEKYFLSTPGRLRHVKIALAFAALAAERMKEKTPAPAARPGLLGKLRSHLKLPDELFVLVLMPQIVRGTASGATEGEIPIGARPLQINLILEDDLYESYRAEVRTSGEGGIWVEENLTARVTEAGATVILTLSQGLASATDYTVILSGAFGDGDYEKVGTYFFNTK